MGRQKHSDSSCNNNHDPKNKSLFHIIKYHPLCHHFIQKRYANMMGGEETNDAGTLLEQRNEAFSCDNGKNLSLAKLRNSNVEEKVTPHSSVGKRCVQCVDATSRSDYWECNLCCKHHRPTKNDLLARKVIDKKSYKVESNARKHIFGVYAHLCRHFVGGLETTNKNKEILLTFLHDPVFPTVYHFHKQHVQRRKMKLNRSESSPLPYSSSKTKWKGTLYCDNITQESVRLESSKTAYEQVMPSVTKEKVNGNFKMSEGVIIVRNVKVSSVCAKGQNSLKQKIENVSGESEKEKIRVGMDSVIHKLPQGQRISDKLKEEILKKLTEPIITREVRYKNSIRRIMSLQEPLLSYYQQEETRSPLRMLIPFQRILSLPDLRSFSYASVNGDISDLSQENLPIIDENDLVISNNVKSGSDCINKINGKVDLRNCENFSDQDIDANKEYKAAIAASASDSISKLAPIDRPDNMAQKMEILSKKLNHEIPHIHVDTKYKDEFNYVKYVLEISGLTSNESISAWYSKDTPIDPSLYEEMENDPNFCANKGDQCNHHVLFDLINETVLEIYGRSHCYPPIGCHILHKVWTHMSKSLCLRSKVGQKIDDHISKDLSKSDGCFNVQFYGEDVGLEVEEMIFQDLLVEIMWDFACL
ncbi:uncharacterized protein LOC123923777 [Trifolium pratense]|uniref:uncharacterized protein LOC123923777 n=1 Tax=Trifolium pratense TaxID=57577 RepID=UPI001E694D10|nr:uncharacterized protein LOC123923777 [Trifolium pratense]XP_045832468.1 uncharacterized protein LOC123923777 [Trifolium pratense]